ncbi:MAG: hypothetical protein QXZ17_00560 [Nitrososphaerota archaeon]
MRRMDNLEKALKIIAEGEKRGATIRLIGGLAIYYHSPSAINESFARTYGDIDFFGLSSQTKIIKNVMNNLGYIPHERFNALHGERRLLYYDESNGSRIDFLLDYFEMCHKIDLRERLRIDNVTIPLADLLLTKLQIVELTEKDIKDLAVLLIDHELSDKDEEDRINVKYIAKLCSNDWGLEKTIKMTFDKVLDWTKKAPINEQHRNTIVSRIEKIRSVIDAEPKSMKWKMRAKIGEKVRWYEIPEEPLR